MADDAGSDTAADATDDATDEVDAITSSAPRQGKGLLIGGIAMMLVIVVVVAVSASVFGASLEKAQEGTDVGAQNITDGIKATATVSNVDPVAGQMTVRIAMDPVGNLDQDNTGLLDRPVTLYYDSVDGTKQIDFKAGKPLGSTDLTVPLLGGTVSAYPWDKYNADIQLQFLTTSESASASSSTGSGGTSGSSGSGSSESSSGTGGESSSGGSSSTPASGTSAPAAAAAPKDTIVPAEFVVFKQVPAYSVVDVSADPTNPDGVLGVHFEVRRASTAIFFSLLVTAIMWVLALGVAFMALMVVTHRRKFELAVMSFMAIILFAMPAALRSFQPGIPPPGVLSDFYGFFWCDIIVAVALSTVLVTYLRRGTD